MSHSELKAGSDSVKGSSRLGAAWSVAVMIIGMLAIGMLAIMAPFTSGDANGGEIEEIGKELERVAG